MSLYEPEMCPQQVEPEPDGALIFFFSSPVWILAIAAECRNNCVYYYYYYYRCKTEREGVAQPVSVA